MMMISIARRRSTVSAGLLALGLLAACSNSEPENPPTETPEAASVTDTAPAPVAEPAPAPAIAPPTGLQPPDIAPEPVAPDVQMLDDADASGMTARARRDEPADGEQPADDATPAASDPTPADNDMP